MKTMHIHISVKDIEESVKFYSSLFGAKPTKQKNDYAKWMLEDPRLNFAISNRASKKGLDHFGIQVSSENELEEITTRLKAAEQQLFDEGVAECCYAKSNKAWVEDPSGIAWEAYETMKDIEIFGPDEAPTAEDKAEACCAPSKEQQNKCC